jgi:hypothetical protein
MDQDTSQVSGPIKSPAFYGVAIYQKCVGWAESGFD